MVHKSTHLKLIASPLTGLDPPKVNEDPQAEKHAEEYNHSADGPHFHKHHEARPIELFYDLFFVANLSVFTYIHPVNDSESLRSYIGFFSILWFTWLQVTLFDVRFGNDSLFERLLKAFHLAGMITGTSFLPSELVKDRSLLIGFTCILMGTRLALALQYLVTLWASRKFATSITPLLLHVASYFTAAVAYAIMAGAFAHRWQNRGYVAWYVIMGVETASTVAIARIYKVASFRGTHLAERLSLLTLIIIGEGIIVLMKTIQTLTVNGSSNNAVTIGSIFCVTVIYFLLYMLYFDKLRKSYFGLIREEIWTLLHFPFHVALILFVEGINEMVLARRFYEEFNTYFLSYNNISRQSNATTVNAAILLNDWLSTVTAKFPDAIFNPKDLTSVVGAVKTLNDSKVIAANSDFFLRNPEANTVAAFGINLIFSGFGLKHSKFDKSVSLIDRVGADMEIFQLIFGYLFITGGLILIFLALFSYINKTHRTRLPPREWINITAHVVTGLALALISLLLLKRPNYSTTGKPTILALAIDTARFSPDNVFDRYSTSAWPLPTILLGYFLVVAVSLVVMMIPSEKGHDQRAKYQVVNPNLVHAVRA
ncbi:MAG: hypothetical protein M1814_005958 [Vezdaea aestivalis]|nr:MAG: hypothetical protein M1814_005958 [Vezdaea aestivalis]